MALDETLAVQVDGISKVYRLYEQPSDRLKELLLGRLGRRFSRDFWALRDVSFTLARGQRLGVIGRNGSGKSTLLQILAATLAPTAGSVQVRGRVAALLELGSGFNPEYTGRENVYLNASILGMSQRETDERFDTIASFADIGEFIDQPVKMYSSGMFVRLAFAVATSVDADVLLIDEALAVGDVFFTQKCFRHLQRLIETGVSIILVTHDAATVHQFCDAALVLDQGRTIFHGDTAAGIRAYFAVQRLTIPAPRTENAAASPCETDVLVPRTGGMPDWPEAAAFLPLDNLAVLGDGARCTGIALCDERGQPCRVFEMGQEAVFFLEFTLEEGIQAPIAGIEILNERNIVVHGKSSLQHKAVVPSSVPRGTRLRWRQRITLNIAQGSYSFALGLASITHEEYTRAEDLSYEALASRIHQLLVVSNAGSFSMVGRRQGQALPFHGLCDLDGDVQLTQLSYGEDDRIMGAGLPDA